MKIKFSSFKIGLLLWIAASIPCLGQGVSNAGARLVPVGYCQIATLSSAVGITATSCVRASFTGTGSGTNLTAASVTGVIKIGDGVAGTGVPAGTTIVSQTSGTTGGAGVYITSQATTSSGASLTSGGIPPSATLVYIVPETQAVRYRDDGANPTASVGEPIANGGTFTYQGTMSALAFIEQTASAKLNLSFYKAP